MDLEERFLKLVSLGWDCKEDPLKFLLNEYGVNVWKLGNMINISFKTKNGSSVSHIIKFDSGKRDSDPIFYALRLFRTVDGEVKGPESSLFVAEDQEWT